MSVTLTGSIRFDDLFHCLFVFIEGVFWEPCVCVCVCFSEFVLSVSGGFDGC